MDGGTKEISGESETKESEGEMSESEEGMSGARRALSCRRKGSVLKNARRRRRRKQRRKDIPVRRNKRPPNAAPKITFLLMLVEVTGAGVAVGAGIGAGIVAGAASVIVVGPEPILVAENSNEVPVTIVLLGCVTDDVNMA